MDATGELVRPPSTDFNRVLIYAIIVPIKALEYDPTDPFPLTEMISASHSADTIGIF